MIGETGVGKSSFCNTIIGQGHDAKVFPVSFSNYSVTHATTIENRYYKNDRSRPIRVIDTQGFNDPGSTINQKHHDYEIQAELLNKLGEVDGVHRFIICVNATNPRVPPSLVKMIETFLNAYGYRLEGEKKVTDHEEFWKRCVINFTRFSFNEEVMINRRKARESKAQIEHKTQEKLEMLFGFGAQGLEHFFIDSHYSKSNPEENERFHEETERLYLLLLTKSAARSYALKIALKRAETLSLPGHTNLRSHPYKDKGTLR